MLNKQKAMAWATLGFVIGTQSIPIVAYADMRVAQHREQHRALEERLLLLEDSNSSLEEEKDLLERENASLRGNNAMLESKCNELEEEVKEQQVSIDKLVATEKELTAKLKASEVAKEQPFKSIVAESMAGEVIESTPETTTPPCSDGWTEVKIEATFYTALPEENGGEIYAGINALGGKLQTGSLAVPKEIPLGTEFIIDGLPSGAVTNRFVADDRGGAIKMKGDTVRVDVFVARLNGESDSQYYKRVNALGRVVTTGRYKMTE